MYVDDPVLSTRGSRTACFLSVDLVVCWWLALGLPLAWKKGVMTSGAHRWIGADFALGRFGAQAAGIITAPPEFTSELFDLLSPCAAGRGHVAESHLEKLLGKFGLL